MSLFTITSNNNNAPTSSIVWNDTQTIENRVGPIGSTLIFVISIIDIENSAVISQWQINTGSGFVDNIYYVGNPQSFSLAVGVTQFRLKNTDDFGMVGYSNILQYSTNGPTYDNYNYIFSYGSCPESFYVGRYSFNMLAGRGAVNKLAFNYSGEKPGILRIVSFENTVGEIMVDANNIAITFPYNITLGGTINNTPPYKIIFIDEIFIAQPNPYTIIYCPANPLDINVNSYTTRYEVIDINGISGGIKECNIVGIYDPSKPPLSGLPPLPGPLPVPYYYCLCASDCANIKYITYIDAFGIIKNDSAGCEGKLILLTSIINDTLSFSGPTPLGPGLCQNCN